MIIMKFLSKCLAILCVVATVSFLACADDKPIDVSQLPAPAQTFLKKHFPNDTPLIATIDKEVFSTSYDVRLKSGISVDFDGKGNWTDVDCHTTAVPAAIIPTKIAAYAKSNYSDAIITKIDRDKRGYEIKLSNRLELKFDKHFNLTEIDD